MDTQIDTRHGRSLDLSKYRRYTYIMSLGCRLIMVEAKTYTRVNLFFFHLLPEFVIPLDYHDAPRLRYGDNDDNGVQ